jgi:AraC-like DNA-binding protein
MNDSIANLGLAISPKAIKSPIPKHATTVLQIIAANYSNSQFNVDALAEKIEMSTSFLYEVVYARFGMTPQELIETFRLEQAIHLLARNGEKIGRIRMQSGYSYAKTFRRAFKKRLNLTPQECLERLRHAKDPQAEFNSLLAALWRKNTLENDR